jgi:colanic acid/amylovoran biosynthesis protein WcaK/AmsJ
MTPMKICLMGASTDTGNLGVSALCLSTIHGILSREPGAELTVFDDRRGVGTLTESLGGREFRFRRSGLSDTRRVYRRESLWNAAWSHRFGGIGNPAAVALRRADAVLDITGGDSFTDLYGPRRFRAGCAGKRLALAASGGLVLLPQTYGPFRSERFLAAASQIVASSAMAWARDAHSFDTLRGLAGHGFDEERHRCGVDVAFRLPAHPPQGLPPTLVRWLEERDRPLAGVNVSGLTYLDADRARRAYGLSAHYRSTIHGILDRLLAQSDARVVLVPHVLTPPTHFESDMAACTAAADALGTTARGRVMVAPALDACSAKGLIRQLDWFCGTRMHATIAALSSGVAASALAYSLKTRGVFESCGQGEHVADLRAQDAASAIDTVWRSWESRDDARASLAETLPDVLGRADAQMDAIVATCRDLAARRRERAPAIHESAGGA